MKLQPHWNIEEDHNRERGTSLIGKLVYCHCQEPLRNPSYVLSTLHIIGYDSSKSEKEGGKYFTFVSLADGMTTHRTLDELITMLNNRPYVPIPASTLQAAMLEKQPLR